MNKLLSMIALCRRAGKLVWGFDAVEEALVKLQVHVILLAQDLSPKSEKEILRICDTVSAKVVRIPATMDELHVAIGKRSGILAVTDRGLAEKVASLAQEQNPAG